MKTRQAMISELTEILLNNITWDRSFASLIVSEGFKGYHNYSNEELAEEYYKFMGTEEATS